MASHKGFTSKDLFESDIRNIQVQRYNYKMNNFGRNMSSRGHKNKNRSNGNSEAVIKNKDFIIRRSVSVPGCPKQQQKAREQAKSYCKRQARRVILIKEGIRPRTLNTFLMSQQTVQNFQKFLITGGICVKMINCNRVYRADNGQEIKNLSQFFEGGAVYILAVNKIKEDQFFIDDKELKYISDSRISINGLRIITDKSPIIKNFLEYEVFGKHRNDLELSNNKKVNVGKKNLFEASNKNVNIQMKNIKIKDSSVAECENYLSPSLEYYRDEWETVIGNKNMCLNCVKDDGNFGTIKPLAKCCQLPLTSSMLISEIEIKINDSDEQQICNISEKDSGFRNQEDQSNIDGFVNKSLEICRLKDDKQLEISALNMSHKGINEDLNKFDRMADFETSETEINKITNSIGPVYNNFNDFIMGSILYQTGSIILQRCSQINGPKDLILRRIDISEYTAADLIDLHREIRILRKLKHTFLPRLYKMMRTDNECITIINNPPYKLNLLNMMIESKYFNENMAGSIFKCVCRAIEYLHEQKIVHRNINTDSVWAYKHGDDNTWCAQICDLSWAKEIRKPIIGAVGQLPFMSPEMFAEYYYTTEVDIWAAGVLLYIMLYGELPFYVNLHKEKEYLEELKSNNYKTNFKRLEWLRLSPSASNIVSSCLIVNKAKRPEIHNLLQHSWCKDNIFSTHDLNHRTYLMDIQAALPQIRIYRKSSISEYLTYEETNYNVHDDLTTFDPISNAQQQHTGSIQQ